MELKTSLKSFERARIMPGFYKAVFTGVSIVPKGEHGARIAWKFRVARSDLKDEGDKVKYADGAELSQITYENVTPSSRAGAVAVALGHVIGEGSFDTDDLVGKEAVLVVDDYEIKDKEGGLVSCSGIVKVKPLDKKVVKEDVKPVVEEEVK